ncbi:zinc transporter ZupT [Nitrobacter vulgaris]|uniref:hypothetical protein n=1 Tax=Nitrobacter vulgaris TaxID=29421 RepID=UPI00285779BF|nr:hypothetical protein [Nitrobacter vulgaris]MDR6303997.1 zinc transporter ZupT [Nitrobacter vulgaris]
MDWIIVAGSWCLGALIGALVGWFWSTNLDNPVAPRILAAAVSALAGSSVLAMFSFLAGLNGPTHEYWFYPIGLFSGFTFVMVLDSIAFEYTTGQPRKSQRKRR